MKLTIQGGALNTAAAWAARIAPSKPPIPVMGKTLLKTIESGISLAAHHYDLYGQVTANADITEPGQVVVSANLLSGIAKELRANDEVTLETSSRGLEMRVKRYKASLPISDIQEWEHATAAWTKTGDPIGSIDAAALARGLSRVLPATSTDVTTPMLTAVEFTLADTLTLAATDRYRCASAELPWRTALHAEVRSLPIPRELLATMRDVLNTGDVTLTSDGNTVGLSTGQHQISGRLLDGAYPKWRAVMQQPEPATTVTMNVAALGRAVKQVSAAVEGKQADQLRLEFTEDGIGVALAADPESSSDIVEPGDFTFDGEPLVIGVAGHYLRDALACVDAPMVQLRLNADPTKPFLLYAAGEDGELLADGYQHLLMVMRLRELVAAA